VTVLNAPGTVDAGYRGEIVVNLINHDPAATAHISRGDRIAQLVVQRVERADFEMVEELPDSSRAVVGTDPQAVWRC
jgi:dUTP pyrophosphatase